MERGDGWHVLERDRFIEKREGGIETEDVLARASVCIRWHAGESNQNQRDGIGLGVVLVGSLVLEGVTW